MILPVSVVRCQVRAIEPLTDAVFRVELETPQPVNFKAGQYLQVVMSENDKRPFSIASASCATSTLELHIGATADNPYATEVLELMRRDGAVNVEGPLGEADYRADSQRPLLLMAGGTGFSYTWSILQTHLHSDDKRPVLLYWGARELSDLYLHDELQTLQREHAHFAYRPVLESPPPQWADARGLLHHAVMADVERLADFDVYVAGRFEMVRVVRDDFIQRGLPREQLFGDALSFI